MPALKTQRKFPLQNRGIGSAIAQTVASTFRGPLILYATSRKGIDIGFSKSSETQIKYPKLDITDEESVRSLGEKIMKDHGSVDVLINNAGVNLDDEYSAENVKLTLDTNVRGTLLVSVPNLGFQFRSMCESKCFTAFIAVRYQLQNELPTESLSHLYGHPQAVQSYFPVIVSAF